MDKHLDMSSLWASVLGYMNKGQAGQVMNILTVFYFAL